MVGGILETIAGNIIGGAGASAAAGGGVATATGVGAPAGVGAVAAGVGAMAIGSALVAQGATSIAAGAHTILHAMMMSGNGEGGGRGSRGDDDDDEQFRRPRGRQEPQGTTGRTTGGGKAELAQLRRIGREEGISQEGMHSWGDFLEENKEACNRGTANSRGDFTDEQLRELARDFLQDNPRFRR
jgi:hypothetical protein